MHKLSTCLLLTMAATALAADAERTIRFDKGDIGKLPAGWRSGKTGMGEGSVWKVVADPSAPGKSGHVLAQTAVGPNPLFNLCVLDESSQRDVTLSVAIKSVKGDKDQGGGFVWRYQDANNYYVCRINPVEGNYRLYKVVNGKRTQLATLEDVKLETGVWNRLGVEMVGERIACYLDGKKLLEATDVTFGQKGKVGLWTKADAQTHFDLFEIKSPKP